MNGVLKKNLLLFSLLILLFTFLLSSCGTKDEDKVNALNLIEKAISPYTIKDLEKAIEDDINAYQDIKEEVGKGNFEWRYAKNLSGNIAAKYGYFRPEPGWFLKTLGLCIEDLIAVNPWPSGDYGYFVGFTVDLEKETVRYFVDDDQNSIDARIFWLGELSK